MSKKQKRSVSQMNGAATSAAGPVIRRQSTSVEDFNPDYSSVKSDLKRIGILAGSFIAILVILSFFLG